jgi:zinc transporter ZupT
MENLLQSVLRRIKYFIVGIATGGVIVLIIFVVTAAVEFIGRRPNLRIFIAAVLAALILMWVGKNICRIWEDS